MKRLRTWSVMTLIALGGGTLSSCTTAWLMPTRDAAIDGLANFVSQTVFDVLDRLIDIDGDPS